MQVIATMAPLLGAFETYYHVHITTEVNSTSNDSAESASELIISFQKDSNNFWSPNISGPKLIMDGNMKGGTIDQLIFHLIVDQDIPVQMFMTTYPSFTTSFELLQKLIQW